MAMRQQMLGMTAHQRHTFMMNQYVNFYGGKMPPPPQQETLQTDFDVLRDSYRFIRDEGEDAAAEDRWAVRLAKRYYAKLYREYAIVDLSRYKEGKLGLRWRTEAEVLSGKGQFTCGARGCHEGRGLATFEVPFGYTEAGERKEALVKVRVCPEHALQLNHRKNKEVLKAQRKAERRLEQKKQRRRENSEDADADSDAAETGDQRSRKKRKHQDDTGGSLEGLCGKQSQHSNVKQSSEGGPALEQQAESEKSKARKEGSRKQSQGSGGQAEVDAEAEEFLRNLFP